MKTAIQWIAGAVIIVSMLLLASVALRKLQKGQVNYSITTKLGAIVRLHDPTTGRFFCSAAVISKTQAVTAAHCVMQAFMGMPFPSHPTIDVRPASGQSVNVTAKVSGADVRTDQALLVGNFETFDALEVDVAPAAVIQGFKSGKVQACGYPYGGELFCSDVTNVVTKDFWFAGQANLWPGMSGGPVIDQTTGHVIGVNTAMQDNIAILTPLVELFNNLKVSAQPQ